MGPNIGTIDKDREGVRKLLMALLADEYVLYTKTRNYHWNVARLQLEPYDNADEVAGLARAVGGHAIGTLQEFIQHARVKEHPATIGVVGR